ncbi:MAG: hypothetical protein K8W52_02090 [Deltaproteobacteria bacterium]|nr:hypothetical protein [Deltaproteobacteria bacterium]
MRFAPKQSWSTVALAAAVALSACKSAESKGGGTPPPVAAAGAGDKIAVPGGAGDKVAVPGAPEGAPGTAAPAKGSGAVAEAGPDSSFNLTITAPTGAKAGAEAVAHVEVTPGSGYHVNEDFPTKLVIDPAEGVTVAKAEQAKDDAQIFTSKKLAFDVKLTPTKAGTFNLGGTLKFAVCTETTCDPKKRAIAIALVAQ